MSLSPEELAEMRAYYLDRTITRLRSGLNPSRTIPALLAALEAATPPADDTLLREAAEDSGRFGHNLAVTGPGAGHLGHSGEWDDCPQSLCVRTRAALRAEPEARGLDVTAVQAELDAMYPDDESDVRAHIANIETILGTNRALTVKEAHAMFEATDSARLATTEPTEEQPR